MAEVEHRHHILVGTFAITPNNDHLIFVPLLCVAKRALKLVDSYCLAIDLKLASF